MLLLSTALNTFVLHDVAVLPQVPLDQGDPHQLLVGAAPAAARLHEPSEREVDLPPSPVRDPFPAEPEDRGSWLLPAPCRSLASGGQPPHAALPDVGENQRGLRPPRLVYPLAALTVAQPFPHAARERGLEGIGTVVARHASTATAVGLMSSLHMARRIIHRIRLLLGGFRESLFGDPLRTPPPRTLYFFRLRVNSINSTFVCLCSSFKANRGLLVLQEGMARTSSRAGPSPWHRQEKGEGARAVTFGGSQRGCRLLCSSMEMAVDCAVASKERTQRETHGSK